MIEGSYAEGPKVEAAPQPSDIMRRLITSITKDQPIRLYKPRINYVDFKLTEEQKADMERLKSISTPEKIISDIFKKPPPVFVDLGFIPEVSKENQAMIDLLRTQGMPDDKIWESLGLIRPFPNDKETDISFVQPPRSIRVFYPTPADFALSKAETVVPDNYEPEIKNYLEIFLKNCKLFLTTPRINDSFGPTKEDHNKRRLWEEGVRDVFLLIDKSWGDEFIKTIDNNRYSKNRRTTLVSFLTIFDGYNLPKELKNKINRMKKEFVKSQILADNDRPEAAAHKVSAQAASFIRFFSKGSPATR